MYVCVIFIYLFTFSSLNLKGVETLEFSLCHWSWIAGNKLLCICSYRDNKIPSFALLSFDVPCKFQTEQELYGR